MGREKCGAREDSDGAGDSFSAFVVLLLEFWAECGQMETAQAGKKF